MLPGISQAIHLNNQAVVKLQDGELREAAVTLRQAIAMVRQAVCTEQEHQRQREHQRLVLDTTTADLNKLPSDEGRRASTSAHFLQEPNSVLNASFSSLHSSEDASMDVMDMKPTPIMTGIESVQTMPGTTLDDGSLYVSIYDQAFSIHQDEDREDLICTVIFYNLALVQHKRNMTNGRNLWKVLSIYERADTVAQNLAYGDQDILLLLLAINNNKMQIHATLFDRPALLGSLMKLKALVGERPTDEDVRFEFFVLNSICFAEEPWRCAPMA